MLNIYTMALYISNKNGKVKVISDITFQKRYYYYIFLCNKYRICLVCAFMWFTVSLLMILAIIMLLIQVQWCHSTHNSCQHFLKSISVSMHFASVFFAARMSWSVLNGLFWCIDCWTLFWQCKLELIPAYLFGLVKAGPTRTLLIIPGHPNRNSLFVLAKQPNAAFGRLQEENYGASKCQSNLCPRKWARVAI